MTAFTPPPLAFGHHQARMDHDPDRLAAQIARAVPFRDLTPLHAEQPFTHRASVVRAGQLEITAAAHSPLRGANHAQAKAAFTLPFVGKKHVQINGRSCWTRAGHNALLLPGEAFTQVTSRYSGVVFSVCPKAIAEAATTMAGGPEQGPPLAAIQDPVELLEGHPPQANLLSRLRRTLDPREASAFTDLISALRGDLQGEWTLSRMERRAGLSRTRLRGGPPLGDIGPGLRLRHPGGVPRRLRRALSAPTRLAVRDRLRRPSLAF